jgi:hypothetical protein
MVFETLVFSPLNYLTRVIAQENFIILSCQESNKAHYTLLFVCNSSDHISCPHQNCGMRLKHMKHQGWQPGAQISAPLLEICLAELQIYKFYSSLCPEYAHVVCLVKVPSRGST